jgi:hypothetical protein
MASERTPWHVVHDLSEAHQRMRDAAMQLSDAKAAMHECEVEVGRLEAELLPLFGRDGEVRYFATRSDVIEAARDGDVVSTTLIEPEQTVMLAWPTLSPADAAVAIFDEEVA